MLQLLYPYKRLDKLWSDHEPYYRNVAKLGSAPSNMMGEKRKIKVSFGLINALPVE